MSERPAFGPGWGMSIHAAARLSFTLIDLNGSTGRRNGMASLSLRDPSLKATLLPEGAEHAVVGDTTYHAEIRALLDTLQERYDGPAVHCRLDQPLPEHHGFGSKTATLLAVGKAYAALCPITIETAELARLAGRGGTSGAGVNLIDRGGFLVDGGHANPDDFDDDPHRYLLPSRFAGAAVRKPPVLINLPFPPWPILVFVTEGVELHGTPELDWFRQTLPIPHSAACRTAHLVLMNLAPAIAESDYPAFCRALDRLTFETYYKQEQIAIQPEAVRKLLFEGRSRPEIDALGISVTGPMCFAFTRDPRAALTWMRGLRAEGVVRDFWFTTANNHPAVLSGVPAGVGA